MKKELFLITLILFTLISCNTDSALKEEKLINNYSKVSETNANRKQNGPQDMECTLFFTVDLSNHYYLNSGSSPISIPTVEFTWDFSNAVVACNINAYIEITDIVNGGAGSDCSYEFFTESYPININSTNPLILDTNNLTSTPFLTPNPSSPTGYNEIYGTKCFLWRLKVTGNSCIDSNIRCETTTDWEYFEWN